MAALGTTDFYYSDLVLNADGSVSFKTTHTLGGTGTADPQGYTKEQFMGFYVDEWMVPRIKSNDHGFTFLPIHALAAAVAIQQGKVTAAQYETYLSSGASQPVGGMKGLTSYDYIAGTTIPTVKEVAVSPTLMAVSPTNTTTVNVVQQAAAQIVAVGKDLPALSSNQVLVEKMYLAAFLRAPEKGGLDYWTGLLNSGKSLTEVGDVIFSLPIVKAIYAADMSPTAFVTAIYNNVFGKAPEADGLAFWLGQLGTGEHRGDLVMAMINAGLGSAVGTPGRDYIVNRLDAVQYAVQSQIKAGAEVSVDALISLSSKVGANAADIAVYQNAIDAAIARPSSAGSVELIGSTPAAVELVL